jgi:hypothetical protein
MRLEDGIKRINRYSCEQRNEHSTFHLMFLQKIIIEVVLGDTRESIRNFIEPETQMIHCPRCRAGTSFSKKDAKLD